MDWLITQPPNRRLDDGLPVHDSPLISGRLVEVVSKKNRGQHGSVMPRLGEGSAGEKVAKDKFGLQVWDPLIAHHKITFTADMFTESCRIGR